MKKTFHMEIRPLSILNSKLKPNTLKLFLYIFIASYNFIIIIFSLFSFADIISSD